MYFNSKELTFNSFIYFSAIFKKAYGEMEFLNGQDEGFIQHERQMNGKSCGDHVIEVKKFEILSKPKKPLTLI